MNFRRIEWIFLIFFVALDVFLWLSYQQNDSATLAVNTAASSTIIQDLRDDNIVVRTNLSKKQRQGYYLAASDKNSFAQQVLQLRGQNISLKNNTLSSTFTSQILVTKKDRLAQVTKLMADKTMILYGHQYRYSKEFSTNSNMVFLQTTKYGTLVDAGGRLTFALHNGRVEGYTQTYFSNITVVKEKQTAISLYRAVQTLYTLSEIPQDSTLLWSKYGYSKLVSANGSTVFVPTWLVMIRNNTTKSETLKRVNALNNTVLNRTASGN